MLEQIEAAFHKWMVEHIYGSPISQHTPAYNHLAEKLPILQNSIMEICKPETVPEAETK